MSPSVRVAVVGAGWAGLAAATTLSDYGVDVTVFESARQAGGRARRVEWNGLAIDNGQHLLVGAYRETLALLRQVGIDPDAALLRLPMRIEVPGRFSMRLPGLPAPLHLAIGLFAASGVSFEEKLAAARFIRRLQARGYRLQGDCTVADWLDDQGQHGVLREHLWNALCIAALNTRPKEASAQVFANVLRDTLGGARAATDFLLPRIDLGALLPDAATRHLAARGARLRCPERVRAVRPEGAAWVVSIDAADEAFDRIILAVGAPHVAALLPEDRRVNRLRQTLDRLTYEPIGTAYLRYPQGCRLPSPILALNSEPAQWVVDRGRLAPAGDGLLAHVLSARGPWEALGDEALVRVLDARLRDALPACRSWPGPIEHFVIREKRATFRCVPDLERPTTVTAMPGLWLAGDYVRGDYPGTLEAAVISGRAAAHAVLKY
jgi:squalene-associated FAD-dependent desaturase